MHGSSYTSIIIWVFIYEAGKSYRPRPILLVRARRRDSSDPHPPALYCYPIVADSRRDARGKSTLLERTDKTKELVEIETVQLAIALRVENESSITIVVNGINNPLFVQRIAMSLVRVRNLKVESVLFPNLDIFDVDHLLFSLVDG
jgi:hypothetical protein